MGLFEASPALELSVRRTASAAFFVGALLSPLAAGAQVAPPGSHQISPAAATPPRSTSARPSSGTLDAPPATSGAAAPEASSRGNAGDVRPKDGPLRTTTRARQRLRECRAEAAKRPHLWGLARVRFIKRCRRTLPRS